MHKVMKEIENRIGKGDGELAVSHVTLRFISETDGKTVAEYFSESGLIKKEDNEWTVFFQADGELHAFPIAYAYEAEQSEAFVILHYDYEDDEYVVVQFKM